MEIFISFQSVLSLFLIVITGYIAVKKKLVSSEFSYDVSQFLFYISIPCTMIHSITQEFSQEVMIGAVKMLIYSLIFLIVGALLSKLFLLLFRERDYKKSSVYEFSMTISNYGFMGWPICQTVFGDIGLFYSSVFGIPINILFYIYGQAVFGKIEGKKERYSVKKFLNPPVIGTLIGIILFFAKIKLPSVLDKATSLLGNTTAPLSMAVAGMMLATSPLKNIFTEKKVFLYSGIRLLVIPLLVFLIMRISGEQGIISAIPVTIAAMPAPANITVLTEKYGGDSLLGAQVIFISTLLSVVTIPIIMTLLL